MISRSRVLSVLLGGAALALACQFLSPAPQSCIVHMPTSNRAVRHLQGDEITYTVDSIGWAARVDCNGGRLVEGHPVRPEGARETTIAVADSSYRLITSDPAISMQEDRTNGSNVRIEMDGRYYVAALYADPGDHGLAFVRYFIGGQTAQGISRMYCYNRTAGQDHTFLPALAASWVVDAPGTVALVCSAQDFILELSTDVTTLTLQHGPTLVPPTPGAALTPKPPGYRM